MGLAESLGRKQKEYIEKLRGIRKPEVTDVFERVTYLGPHDFAVTGFKKKTPVASFNPGAWLEGDEILLFPRLIFDYYCYTSSIGLARMRVEDAVSGRVRTPLSTQIILWPRSLWEFLGCEDPRIFKQGGRFYVLYTGKGYYLSEEEKLERRDVLGLTVFDESMSLIRRGFFKIVSGSEELVPKSNKDSAFLRIDGSKASMLTRPELDNARVCWRAECDVESYSINADTLEPVLVPEGWEFKVGWSTNAVKVSSNEFIIGWHGVLKWDYSYRDGLAVVDDTGELLAVSNYLIAPHGLIEEYGDRPLVVFGDGLVLYKNKLVWIGGVSDYAIAVMTADLDKVMDLMKWVRG